MIKKGEELWKKYCSFLDKPFSEQVEYNELKLKEYFKRWKQTKMAKQLCPNGVKRFEDVPLTTYDDYPILHEFGAKVEHLSKTVPRRKGELMWDYYDRISRTVSPMLDGWIVGKYSFCSKTSGTMSDGKWIVFNNTSYQNFLIDTLAIVISGCSDEWGNTKLRKGDTVLNVMAPVPYISGHAVVAMLTILNPVIPLQITDSITNIRKKVWLALKAVKKGRKVDFAGGVASSFYMASQYLKDPASLFKDNYKSMKLGIIKAILFLKWFQTMMTSHKYERTRDFMPLKGIVLSGVDTNLYETFIKNEYEVDPINAYCSTEFGIIMFGPPDRKSDLMPNLRSCHFEFLTEKGELKKIDELNKGKVYGLVGTPIGSILLKYDIGDLLRVIDIRDDGMPIFNFEGRRTTILDIYGYLRLSESMVVKALSRAGLCNSEKWAVTKLTDPKEHILFLMEKDWKYSEENAAKLIFRSLKELTPDFQKYVSDFKIRNPSEVIKVEYLPKGAFMRYSMKKAKEKVELGQMKAKKLIPPENSDIVELLRKV